MPPASVILIAIAVLLVVLASNGYRKHGALKPQHRTWILIAVIFCAVVLVTSIF